MTGACGLTEQTGLTDEDGDVEAFLPTMAIRSDLYGGWFVLFERVAFIEDPQIFGAIVSGVEVDPADLGMPIEPSEEGEANLVAIARIA